MIPKIEIPLTGQTVESECIITQKKTNWNIDYSYLNAKHAFFEYQIEHLDNIIKKALSVLNKE